MTNKTADHELGGWWRGRPRLRALPLGGQLFGRLHGVLTIQAPHDLAGGITGRMSAYRGLLLHLHNCSRILRDGLELGDNPVHETH
eukprot:CAMPEP_0204344796 /NCGR_PEP_ID=MMETSP0469-20131031/25894_1 /ASSEMBLY_ACC=CAM_ASM_000384 /TAXON_ID=2969 /ORGANISM="Oxyrrhis marina" /LENGTH=85 /DNA_ID=CAMNT_0051330113 /DNA_START=318 /DNA_END=575 /DNA_ORIENTATION=+